jgi:hypothetical protein
VDKIAFTNIPDAAANERRAEYYAGLIEPKLANCAHAGLLDNQQLAKGRKKIIKHLADVALRIKMGFGDPGEITLDDALCLSCAQEMMTRSRETKRRQLLDYIDIPSEDREALAAKLAKYQAKLLGTLGVYRSIDPVKLELILRSEFTSKLLKSMVVKEGVAVNQNEINRRISDARNLDKIGIALFYLGSEPVSTLKLGAQAYSGEILKPYTSRISP